jgi:hypothetical protein
MKRTFVIFLLIGLILASLILVTRVYAQRDGDGDGVPDNIDHCPTVPGPPGNHGCPERSEGAIPGDVGPPSGPDSDSDGISDRIDLCPQNYGPPDTGGCPPEDASMQPVPFTPLLIPADAPCSVAAKYPEGVNVRAFFSLEAPIIGAIDAQHTYPVQAEYIKPYETWYLLVDPAGFVLSDVVTIGGQCENLTQICVYVRSGPGSETQQTEAEAALAPPLALSVVGVESTSADNAECEAATGVPPQSGEPQLTAVDVTAEWPVECYLGLMDGLGIGLSVATTSLTAPGPVNVYQSPFDEEPSDIIGSLYYGSIIDGPVCRDGIIMWKVTLKFEQTGDTVVGWVRHEFLFPVPE